MVKYCPVCEFTTVGHKLGRHLESKHWALIAKPRAVNKKKICDIIATESRKFLPGVTDPPNPFAGLHKDGGDVSIPAGTDIEERPEISAAPEQTPGTSQVREVTPPMASGQVATVASSKT